LRKRLVLADVAVELPSTQRADVEQVVIDKPHETVAGFVQVVDVIEADPEVTESPVLGVL
jgi:hypothetical protein